MSGSSMPPILLAGELVAKRQEGGETSPSLGGFAATPPVNGAGDTFLVGPNAVTQLATAIEARCGSAMADAVFTAGRVLAYRTHPPQKMIPQDVAIAAHKALARLMRPDEAEAIAFDAGLRTGDYLLAHRIPKPAQFVLRLLPARLAARLLTVSIGKHAWTFAGSGAFSARLVRDTVILDIADNPLAANGCAWHRGVFERLFATLVARRAKVVETQCCAVGARSCRFEINLAP